MLAPTYREWLGWVGLGDGESCGLGINHIHKLVEWAGARARMGREVGRLEVDRCTHPWGQIRCRAKRLQEREYLQRRR